MQNEALCLALARACGLDAVDATIIAIPPPVLVVRRHDRAVSAESVTRIHQLDFCQLASVLPDQKYEKDGGPSLPRIFELVDHYSQTPGKDRLKVVDWTLFNYLIGNADAHGKNLAILVTGGNKMRLAPCYDILCTAIYSGLDTRMAMAIGDEYRPQWVRKNNWKSFAQQTRVNPSLLRKRALALAAAMNEQLPDAATHLGLRRDSRVARKIFAVLKQRTLWAKTHMDR